MNCPNDDLGKNCKDCTCKYNPVVLIATHERTDITTKNIRLLRQQSVVPKILIVCSLRSELEYYKTLDVSVVMHENLPLGKKWQNGVRAAAQLVANPLIILGSDDILHRDYIKNALIKLNEGYDFVGSTSWFSYDEKRGRLYRCEYMNVNKDYPIGSGKVYSKDILDKIRNKVFDSNSSRKLDDNGYRMISSRGANIYLNREPLILAVKGNWVQMNDIGKYLHSPNIKCELVDNKYLSVFNYV